MAQILVEKELDYEQIKEFYIDIIAKDNANAFNGNSNRAQIQRTSTAQVFLSLFLKVAENVWIK